MTTSPVRCIMPKTGGFSFSSVPRPRSPFSRRRRPSRPFFDLLILLSFRLRFVVSLFRDLGRVAVGAGDPLGPTHRSNGLKAPGIVDEVQYVEHPCTHHPS